jgi:mannosyltransferase OCH1-like enzyme
LLRGYDAVFTEQSVSDNTIPNGFFAIIPNHKIFAGITWKLKERSKLYVTQATGPLFISALVRDYISKNGKNGLKILPPKYILPFDWIQKNSEPTYSDCIINHDKCFIHYPEAYGFCLWTGAWIGKYY